MLPAVAGREARHTLHGTIFTVHFVPIQAQYFRNLRAHVRGRFIECGVAPLLSVCFLPPDSSWMGPGL